MQAEGTQNSPMYGSCIRELWPYFTISANRLHSASDYQSISSLLLYNTLPQRDLQQYTFIFSQFLWVRDLAWLSWLLYFKVSHELQARSWLGCNCLQVSLEKDPLASSHGYWQDLVPCHMGLPSMTPCFIQAGKQKSNRENLLIRWKLQSFLTLSQSDLLSPLPCSVVQEKVTRPSPLSRAED